jgi:hypothetical protein
MKKSLIVGMIVLTGLLSVVSMAQEKTPVINQRQRNQQARIREGVKSGELTRGETARLEAREGKIQADKLQAKSDGKVTPAERRKLNREENRASRAIHRMKHHGKKAG